MPTMNDTVEPQHTWVFLADPDKRIILNTITPTGGIQPVLLFATAEIFLDFCKDVTKAKDIFIPAVVQDAISVLDRYESEGMIEPERIKDKS